MPWRNARKAHCKVCKRKRAPDELLSARGKCASCGDGNMLAQTGQMRNHDGPYFDEWRRRMAACVGAVLLDENQAQD